jgi:broad specificity phosphatase PhoE
MPLVYFISHPEVVLNREIPVTQWDLSERGLQRLAMMTQPWFNSLDAIFSSCETKAMTAAKTMAQRRNLAVQYCEDLGEMDRSSTGILEPPEFDRVVEEFFAEPHQSVRGWERAVDAQSRIIHAVENALSLSPDDQNIAIVSHGGVGTLLITHLKQVAINRAEDQPGQGHFFVFDREMSHLHQEWTPIDEIALPLDCGTILA